MDGAYIQANRWRGKGRQEVQDNQSRGNRAGIAAQEKYGMARTAAKQPGSNTPKRERSTRVDGASSHKGRKPVDPNETRDQKLERLATARVTRACKYIAYCGNLAAYKPTSAQVEKILGALVASCQGVQRRLEGTRVESFTFTLN